MASPKKEGKKGAKIHLNKKIKGYHKAEKDKVHTMSGVRNPHPKKEGKERGREKREKRKEKKANRREKKRILQKQQK
jgi:hypothetical protein